MRTSKTILTLILALFFMASCQSDSSSKADSDNTTQTSTDNAIQPIVPTNTPPPPEPAQNADGVWHYTCAKGCAGGAGTQTACAVCGETLTHNASYHNSGAPTTDPTTNPTTIPTAVPTSPAIANPEPPQNDNGVWHFTCAKGCTGGAGSAQPCAGCGEILSHNQAYHQ